MEARGNHTATLWSKMDWGIFNRCAFMHLDVPIAVSVCVYVLIEIPSSKYSMNVAAQIYN